MRSIAALLAALSCSRLRRRPRARARSPCPFGSGDADGRRGLERQGRRRRAVRLRGHRHRLPERRARWPRTAAASTSSTRPPPRRSWPSTTTLGYTKASAATALCAYSFAAVAGRHAAPLRRRHDRERGRDERRQLGRAGHLQRGRLGDRARDAARQQRRLRERLGDARRPDGARPRGQRADGRADRASRRLVQWEAWDPESGAPSVAYAIDGGARIALRAQACSWLCGSRSERQRGDRPLGARRRAALP